MGLLRQIAAVATAQLGTTASCRMFHAFTLEPPAERSRQDGGSRYRTIENQVGWYRE